MKVVNILFIFGLIYSWKCCRCSCDYTECNCVDQIITCIDVAAPRFKYRPIVTRLYLQNVQIMDIRKLIHNLPNLKYVTLVNVNYFKCKWLE